MKNNRIPKDGFEGLKQNFSSDAVSGFLVFLLALPLSLGIAGASDFPPIYGLVTAMIGGLIVSLFAGSPLTIKGPAAGLIVIVAGAVSEFGTFAPSGSTPEQISSFGWHLTLGAVVIAGVLQVLFGFLKLGALGEFFPLSAVHGMLAAIGIIIISKQLHVLVGMNPTTQDGKPMVEPLELLLELKNTCSNLFEHKEVAIIGFVSLIIVFGWPMLPFKKLKKLPSALVVLVVSIPLSIYLGLHDTSKFKPLLDFNEGLIEVLGVNVSFEGLSYIAVFIKFVVMFALVGSLEALLTVKAIDMQDPYRRKSDSNRDLIAVGIGNVVSGIIGGLPMISEVARSSANVANGGKTRWANFFHGFFMLLFLLFAVSFSEMIPKAALAAMLIGVGWKLAHPREFGHMAKIGLDQVAVFILTIIVTLLSDLLVGIAAGILLKIILHLFRGVSLKSLFNANCSVDGNTVHVQGAAIFSNFIKVRKQLLNFTYTSNVIFDVRDCHFVDHTVIESLHHLKDDFNSAGGTLTILGLEEFKNIRGSKHLMSAKRKKRN
jgi:MFS superfamily sulfate permease-like transporter